MGIFSASAVKDGAASEIWIVAMCFAVTAAMSPVPRTRLPMALVQLRAGRIVPASCGHAAA